jgi:membrane fusion protein, multidrug efflux system
MRNVLLYIGLAFSIALAGCGLPGAGSSGKAAANPAGDPVKEDRLVVPVEAGYPERGVISSYFETTTRVEAERRVEVTSQGSGKCLEVLVEEGDRVSQGDVLAELDKEDMLAQIRQTEVQVRQTQSELERARRGVELDITAAIDYDNAKFNYENSLASLKLQRIQLDNLTIRAPITGVVIQRMVQKGMIVGAGTPVCVLVDPTSFVLNIHPPEREMARLTVGQRAKVAIDSLPGDDFEASIRRINPSVDPASGTVKVQMAIPDAIRKELRESAFAKVRLVMETREDVLLLPKDAVLEENARKYAYVVEEVTPGEDETAETSEPGLQARRVEVQTGLEDSNRVEILSGIDEGTLVVTLGQKNLKEDTWVRLTTAEDEIRALEALSTPDALDKAEEERTVLEAQAEEEKKRFREALLGTASQDGQSGEESSEPAADEAAP